MNSKHFTTSYVGCRDACHRLYDFINQTCVFGKQLALQIFMNLTPYLSVHPTRQPDNPTTRQPGKPDNASEVNMLSWLMPCCLPEICTSQQTHCFPGLPPPALPPPPGLLHGLLHVSCRLCRLGCRLGCCLQLLGHHLCRHSAQTNHTSSWLGSAWCASSRLTMSKRQ